MKIKVNQIKSEYSLGTTDGVIWTVYPRFNYELQNT